MIIAMSRTMTCCNRIVFKYIALVVLVLIITSSFSMQTEAANDKTAPVVKSRMAESGSVAVIIIMKDQPSASTRSLSKGDAISSMKVQASGSQKSLNALLKEEKGDAKDVKQFWIVNAIAVKASPGLIKKIAARDDVERIELDGELRILEGFSARVSQGQVDNATDEIKHINATGVWEFGIDGTGINVSVVDTGINASHPDFSGRVIGWVDFVRGDDALSYDDNGHGTHVAGTVAGNGSGGTATGVAPNVSLFSVKVLNNSGSGYSSAIISGIEWSINNKANLISLSLGSEVESDAITSALNNAIDAGVVVVAAAGNNGPSDHSINYPAAQENVIAVGATDINDVIAGFSSRGPTTDGRIKPDVSAPGVTITSLDYASSGYIEYSGTSMATPHVSGAAALLLHAANTLGISLTPSDIKNILKNTSVDLGAEGNDNTYGAGRIDVFAAIKSLDTAPAVSANPTSYPGGYQAARNGDNITLNATITDSGFGVKNATVNVSSINSSLSDIILTNVSGYWINESVIVNAADGTYYLNITAYDNVSNFNDTVRLSVTVDNLPPVIDTKVATPDSIQANGNDITTLSVIAHDFANVSAISSVTVNLSVLGGNTSVLENNSGIWQTTANTTVEGLNGSLLRIPLNVTDARNNSNTSVFIRLGIKAQVNTETSAGNRTDFNFTVDSSTFNASVTIPAATNLTGSLLAAPVEIPAPNGLKSTGFALNLSNLTFNKSIKLEMEYNSSYFNDPTNSKLRLWNYNSTAGKWEITENSSVDTANSTVSGNTSHFSVFAPMADTTSPDITDVASSSITSTSAAITWNTDEASTSLVKYGTSSGAYTFNRSSTSFVTGHSMFLTGLSASTTYHYVVNSTDQSGNSAESTEKTFTTSSAGGGTVSGGGGGGGGGGASGEPFSNIEVKEKYDLHIFRDKVTSYMFTSTANPVMFVNITGNVNAGEITTSVEALRNTSSLVNKPAPGTVYKNVNIWVGTSGFANPRNIKEAVIKFRVENTWLTTHGFSPGDVVMYRWDGSEWNKLETHTSGVIGSGMVFEARTFEFSPFAISATGQARSTAPGVDDIINVLSPSPENDSTPDATQRRWLPGFTAAAALLVFAIIFIITRKIK
ncbi:MAG: S8 family serine peptidase [Candidatus Methanoperedens sp.]